MSIDFSANKARQLRLIFYSMSDEEIIATDELIDAVIHHLNRYGTLDSDVIVGAYEKLMDIKEKKEENEG